MTRRPGHGLGQHRAIGIEHARRQVAGFSHDSRERRTHQRLRLFLDDGEQTIPHQLGLDRIEPNHRYGTSL